MNKIFRLQFLLTGIFSCLIVSTLFSSAHAQTVTLTPADDAMVYRGNTTNNYGSDVKLQVKKAPNSGLTRNAYLKFDLTGITAAQVGKATLRLYCNLKAFDSVQSVLGVFATGNSWTESTVTWSNAPVLSSNITSGVVASKLNYYEWDVTAYIKQSLGSGTVASMGVADLQQSNNLIELSSKEAVNKPQLVINQQADAVNLAYYFDAAGGDDTGSGTTAAAAWKTLSKINSMKLAAGTKVYFKSGQTFTGLLNINSSGTAASPIVYDTYGGTPPAVIDGQGKLAAVFAYNCSYIDFKNITVTNFRTGAIKADDPFSGVVFMNEDGGTLNHIHLENVKVDRVNSSYNEDTAETVYNGGLQFYSTGSRVPSNWNDVLVQNCTFTNLGRTGFNFRSDWDQRNVNTTFGQDLGNGTTDNWYPSTGILIQNNYFKNITGNGLIVRVAKNALVQGNLFDSCGTVISGNATFTFNTDSTIYQFNEAMHTIYNNGDTDARGIDADFRTKSTIIQYNYLHNNGLGGVVATGGDQTTGQIPQRFNVTSVIRYNLIENNDRQGIAFSGAIDGLDVYNNTFYADATHTDVLIVRSAIWAVAPKNLRFKNNIFYYTGTNPSYSFASGSTQTFTNNLFYGIHPASEPADANKITGDPKLSNPGNNGDGYKYLAGSAALNSGILIANNGDRDYYNVPVSSATAPNVGLYNGPAVNGTLPVTLVNFLAKKANNKTALTWITATETNTASFEAERSVNGIDFEKIGSVHAAANSSGLINYSFDDEHPVKGINYYRIKQVDKDGKFTCSVVRMLNYDDAVKGLTVYPNPADTRISIALNINNDAAVAVVSIFDIQGKKIKEQLFSSGSNIDIDVSGLVRGIYSIQVSHSVTKEVLGSARFLKQ